jgi:RNA polymerase sigma factor (sigma-70 family)
MSRKPSSGVLRQFHALYHAGTVAGLTDAELLKRFCSARDDVGAIAFEALLVRHGPMVFGVCRRVLGDRHAAEDAFQATFLVLVRKAGRLWVRDSLGPWLYAAAHRVAARAVADAARRQVRERRKVKMAQVEPSDMVAGEGLWPELHAEIGRLPEKYRAAVVLCYLEGLTHEEAARQLHWPLGTLKVRLSRARERLRGSLIRRGFSLPAAFLASALASREASASVPAPLINSTVQAAIRVAAGKTAVAGLVSASVASLTEGVIQTMFLTKLKVTVACLLSIGVVATGAGVLLQAAEARNRTQPDSGVTRAGQDSAPLPVQGGDERDTGEPQRQATPAPELAQSPAQTAPAAFVRGQVAPGQQSQEAPSSSYPRASERAPGEDLAQIERRLTQQRDRDLKTLHDLIQRLTNQANAQRAQLQITEQELAKAQELLRSLDGQAAPGTPRTTEPYGSYPTGAIVPVPAPSPAAAPRGAREPRNVVPVPPATPSPSANPPYAPNATPAPPAAPPRQSAAPVPPGGSAYGPGGPVLPPGTPVPPPAPVTPPSDGPNRTSAPAIPPPAAPGAGQLAPPPPPSAPQSS